MEFNKKGVYKFWNKESCGTGMTKKKKYSKEYFDEIEAIRYEIEPMIKPFAEFEKYKDKNILEVGVGAGTDFVNWIRAGAIASGVDLTDEAIKNVNKRLTIESLSSKYLQRADAENLPFKNNMFDLSYSWGVIHHSPNTEKCLSELIRVTKPGGEIKIMVYNRRSVTAFWVYVRNCLLKGKFWKSLTYAVANHVESYGTKAYTVDEIHEMFNNFNEVKLNEVSTVTTWCDKATDSRFAIIKIIHKVLIFLGGGDRVGWFMLIKAFKI